MYLVKFLITFNSPCVFHDHAVEIFASFIVSDIYEDACTVHNYSIT